MENEKGVEWIWILPSSKSRVQMNDTNKMAAVHKPNQIASNLPILSKSGMVKWENYGDPLKQTPIETTM